jgi:hypothetical protein
VGVPDLQGTDNGPWAHLGGASEPTGVANIFFPRTTFLIFHLGGWSSSAPLPADTRQCLVDASWLMKHRGDGSKVTLGSYGAACVMGAEAITATVPKMT